MEPFKLNPLAGLSFGTLKSGVAYNVAKRRKGRFTKVEVIGLSQVAGWFGLGLTRTPLSCGVVMNAVRSEIAVNVGKFERKVQKIGLNRSQASQKRDKFTAKHTTVTMNIVSMLPPSSTRNGDQTVEIWELQLRPKRGCFAKLPEPNFFFRWGSTLMISHN